MARRPALPPTPELEAAHALETSVRDHIQYLVQKTVEAARAANTPPGVAVMAACEFLALMLAQNRPPADHASEITRFSTYLHDRLKELTPDVHEPARRRRTSRR